MATNIERGKKIQDLETTRRSYATSKKHLVVKGYKGEAEEMQKEAKVIPEWI